MVGGLRVHLLGQKQTKLIAMFVVLAHVLAAGYVKLFVHLLRTLWLRLLAFILHYHFHSVDELHLEKLDSPIAEFQFI